MSDDLEFDFDFKSILKSNWLIPSLIFAVIFFSRLPFIFANQAVWWDESQYLLMAKHNILNTPTAGWWEGRSFFFPNLLTLTMIGGFSELGPRLLNLFMVAGISLFTYLLFFELFKKKDLAVIASIVTGFSWVIVFYSFRILRDIPGAFFVIASNYFFIRSFNSPKRFYLHAIISGVLLSLAFLVRSTNGLIGVIYLFYVFLNYRFKPKYYAFIIGALVVFGLLSIPDTLAYGNPLYTTLIEVLYHVEADGGSQAGSPDYYITTYFDNYLSVIALCTIPGLFFLFVKPLRKPNFFVLTTVLFYFFSYSFLTSVKEFRFLIHLTPFLVFIAVYGAYSIARLLVRDKKTALLVLILIFSYSVYENASYGYSRLSQSSSSYAELKSAGESIKSLGINGSVMSQSVPQLTYYSELPVVSFPANESDLLSFVFSNNVKFVVVSLHESSYPDYAFNLNNSIFKPFIALPSDKPILIAYFFNESR